MLRFTNEKALDMTEEMINVDLDIITENINVILSHMTENQKDDCKAQFESIVKRMNDITSRVIDMKFL